jgi:hypothetical protein
MNPERASPQSGSEISGEPPDPGKRQRMLELWLKLIVGLVSLAAAVAQLWSRLSRS